MDSSKSVTHFLRWLFLDVLYELGRTGVSSTTGSGTDASSTTGSGAGAGASSTTGSGAGTGAGDVLPANKSPNLDIAFIEYF